MNWKFKLEEFAICHCHPVISELNCDFVNNKIESWLKNAITVYAGTNNPEEYSFWSPANPCDPRNTHKALLINVEPILHKPTYEELEKQIEILKKGIESKKAINQILNKIYFK